MMRAADTVRGSRARVRHGADGRRVLFFLAEPAAARPDAPALTIDVRGVALRFDRGAAEILVTADPRDLRLPGGPLLRAYSPEMSLAEHLGRPDGLAVEQVGLICPRNDRGSATVAALVSGVADVADGVRWAALDDVRDVLPEADAQVLDCCLAAVAEA